MQVERFIVGQGNPAISKEEFWELAGERNAASISPVAVTAIPVVPWGKLTAGLEMLKSVSRVETVHVPEIKGGPAVYCAARIEDEHAARVAPAGAYVVIDLADTSLVDGARYVIVLNGEPVIRRFGLRPLRWESEAAHNEAAVYFSDAGAEIEVIGRVVRSFKEW